MNKFDILIIGSGLGGLVSGAILAKNGYKVCVLEKHYTTGGNLQVFKRKGCSFSAGMHYGGALEKGQVIYQIFQYLGIYDKLTLSKLDEECFDKIIIGDKEYCYAMGMENFKNKLIAYFPEEKEVIEQYTQKLESIWKQSSALNLKTQDFESMPSFDEYSENAFEYINSLTSNEELRAVLGATNGLYAGDKKKSPLYIHANINNFFIKSAWRIAEDGENLSALLAEVIEQAGGQVLTKKEVVRLNFTEKKISSITTTDGENFFAETFISNIHPVSTFKLIEPGKLRKSYTKRITELENTISTFMLFNVLKKKTMKHINSNIYYSATNKVWDNIDYTEQDWPEGYMLYTTEDANNKGYAESVVVVCLMKWDDVKQWENTRVLKRGDDYLRFKEQKAEKLLKLVQLKFPKIKESIDTIYSASPLTFRDYTGTYQGSMYGIVKDCNNPMHTLLSPRTKISNLHLTGQNIGFHGMLGVIMTSLQTCGGIIDLENLYANIKTSD